MPLRAWRLVTIYPTKLFNLYTSYSVDSVYSLRYGKAENSKRQWAIRVMVNDAKLNLAYLLIRGGELKDASDIINSIPRSEINQDLSFLLFLNAKDALSYTC